MRTGIALSFTLLFAAMAGAAQEPFQIEADRATHLSIQGKVLYSGNVVLTSGTLKVFADNLNIHTRDDQVTLIEALGIEGGEPARFQRLPASKEALMVTGAAARMEYRIAEKALLLSGAVSITRGAESIQAATVTYDLETETMAATAAAGGRVRTIFQVPPPAKDPADAD